MRGADHRRQRVQVEPPGQRVSVTVECADIDQSCRAEHSEQLRDAHLSLRQPGLCSVQGHFGDLRLAAGGVRAGHRPRLRHASGAHSRLRPVVEIADGSEVPLGRATSSGTRTVWGTRFASPGTVLSSATDSGRPPTAAGKWTLDASPAGRSCRWRRSTGRVLALTAKGTAQGSLGPYVLLRRALAGGSWSRVATLPSASLFDPTDLISTQAGTAAVLDGTSILVTTNGGLTVARRATANTGYPFIPSSVAVASAKGLALLCIAQNYMGHPTSRSIQVLTAARTGRRPARRARRATPKPLPAAGATWS